MSTEFDVAPYAAAANLLTLIRRRREGRLPEVLSLSELQRLGIPEGSTSRVLATLVFLGLVEEEGRQTANFARLGRATNDEYPKVLAEILQAAYHRVFEVVDPATANDVQLGDAFRCYQPEAQRRRMVALFVALAREAGVIPGGPIEPRTRRKSGASKPVPPARTVDSAIPRTNPAPTFDHQADYRLLVGLLDQLPADAKWTKEKRDRWLQAVTANLDLLIEIAPVATEPRLALSGSAQLTADRDETLS
jgi:Family of unknown function (DUF5343)/IclR helix-turn-helix domain